MIFSVTGFACFFVQCKGIEKWEYAFYAELCGI